MFGAGLLLGACERKAPGPEECVLFAEAWLGSRAAAAARFHALDNPFDELVRRCLTEPYDRELVACVVGGRRPKERCRMDYARRAEIRREQRSR